MKRSIKLYGHLKEITGLSEIEANVRTVSEAISFLICNWPKLEKKIAEEKYHVLVGNLSIGEEEISNPLGIEKISFIPVVEGAGSNFGKIILGAAMIGLAFATSGLSLQGFSLISGTGLTGWGTASVLTKAAVYIGGALVLGGIADILSPTETIPDSDQEQKSFAFQSPLNVAMPGVPVPIAYGTIVTGSVIVSAGQEISDAS